MTEIKTIEELIEQFDKADFSAQKSALKRINIPTAEFEEYATWEDGSYTRNCIARKDGFEFILLCWAKDAGSPIHGHDGQHCWVYQVCGTVNEKRFDYNNGVFIETNNANLGEGDITYMHDRMGYHSIQNITNSGAMTLHIYANPIDRCEVYNEEKGMFEIVEMEYDTIDAEPIRQTGS